MEISEIEKEKIKETVFPWFEHMDTALNKAYKTIIEEINKEITIYAGLELTENEKEKLKQHITKYGAREVVESVFISIEQYYDPERCDETFEKTVDYIGRICFTRSKNKYGGVYGMVNYIVKIAKNNLAYVNEKLLKSILFKYMTIDNMDKIKSIVASSMSWTSLKRRLCDELDIDLEKF